MKPNNTGGHAAYQDRVLTQLRKYYPDADTSLDAATWEVIEQFWSLDLSPVDLAMQDRYSSLGQNHGFLLICCVPTCFP